MIGGEEKKSKTATALMMFEHTHTNITHAHTLTLRFSATRVYVHGRRGSSYTGTATFREP